MAQNDFEQVLRLVFQTAGNEQITQAARELQNLAKGASDAEVPLDEFADELERLAKTDASLRGLVQAKARLTELRPALEQARERLVALQLQFNETANPSAKLGKELERARKSVRDLTAEQNRLTASITPNTAALQKAGLDTKNLDAAQRQLAQNTTDLQARVRSYGTALREAGGAGGALAKGLRETQAAAKAAAPDLGAVQTGLTKIAAAAAAAVATFKGLSFGGSLVGEAAQLQQGLADVAAVAGGTAEDLGRLREAAEQAAQATGQSVDDILAGLGDLARTGLDTEAAIAALGPALDLAAAGGIGLQQAIEITTTTLSQFSFGAEQAGRIADVLASAANATNSSVQGLGRSLTDVAPLSNQLGISLEDTVAILGRLADAGFRGERAGTALRSVFSQLLDPSSKFREELASLGIESTDFATVLEQLATKGDAGKRALLALGQEAAPAILALSQQGSASIRELATQLQSAEGAAGRVAAIVRDTLSNAFARLRETAGNAAAGLLDGLLVPLQRTLEAVQARLQAFIASPQFDQLRERLATAFDDGLAAVNRFLDGLDFADAIEGIDKLARSASDLFDDFESKASSAAAAINKIGAAFNAIVSAGDAANAALEQLNLQAARYGAEVRKSSIQLAGVFQDVSAELAKVDAEIAELARKEAEAGQRRSRFWQEAQRAAAEYRGEVAQAEGASIDFGRFARTAIGPLVDVVADVAREFENTGESAAAAAADIGAMEVATREAAGGVTDASRTAAAEVSGIGAAGAESARRLLATFEASSAAMQLEAQALTLAIAQAFADGKPTQELEAQFDTLQTKIRATEEQARRLKELLKGVEAPKDPPPSVAKGYQAIAKAADESGKATQQAVQQSTSTLDAYIRALINTQREFADFASTNDKALEIFNRRFEASADRAFKLADAYSALKSTAEQLRQELATQQAIAFRAAAGLDQIAAAADLAEFALADVGSGLAVGLEATEAEVAALLQAIDDVRSGAETAREDLQLLDDAGLAKLEASARRAAENVKRIGDEATQARENLAALEREYQDAADTAAGNEEAVRRRRFEDELRRINELAQQANGADQDRAQRLRKLAEEAFKRDVELIRAREREQAASDDRTQQGRAGGQGSTAGGQVTRQPSQRQPGPAAEPGRTINFNFTAPVLGTPEDLARNLRREFERMDRNGFNPRIGR
jgi:TP901 family phage tail tape measure protein